MIAKVKDKREIVSYSVKTINNVTHSTGHIFEEVK